MTEQPTQDREQQAAELYAAEMDRLVAYAHAVDTVRLAWLQATLRRAETVGPVLYPAAYRNADLRTQQRLVDAAIAFRDALHIRGAAS